MKKLEDNSKYGLYKNKLYKIKNVEKHFFIRNTLKEILNSRNSEVYCVFLGCEEEKGNLIKNYFLIDKKIYFAYLPYDYVVVFNRIEFFAIK